jgi:hypothetical protein
MNTDMMMWVAFGLYCLFAGMMSAALIKESKDADIEDSLRPSLYVLIVITAAGWPVSLACVWTIRLGTWMSRNKTQ